MQKKKIQKNVPNVVRWFNEELCLQFKQTSDLVGTKLFFIFLDLIRCVLEGKQRIFMFLQLWIVSWKLPFLNHCTTSCKNFTKSVLNVMKWFNEEMCLQLRQTVNLLSISFNSSLKCKMLLMIQLRLVVAVLKNS